MKIKISLFVILPLLLLTVLTTSVFAVGKPDGVGKPLAQGTGQAQGKLQAQTHLTDAKLKSCQARENAIKNRSTHLVNLVTTMESKFDAIATRVEEYYTSKVVPSGKTVSNYDSLVADIQTQKTAVQSALTTAQTNSTFDCTSADPKTQMTQFRTDMMAVQSALKDYRTSIKNLIVAVHSVTGTENSESPKPTQ